MPVVPVDENKLVGLKWLLKNRQEIAVLLLRELAHEV